MAEWVETYRGVVNAWECDIVEHFTIAYYFERFADATRNFLELVGEGETLGPAVGADKSRLYTTFTRELRAGAGFHMLSAVAAVDESSLQLGHRVVELGECTDGVVGYGRAPATGLGDAAAASPARGTSVRVAGT